MKVTLYDPPVLDGMWGVRVAESDTHYVNILPMLVNHRVIVRRKDDETAYEAYWCYSNEPSREVGRLSAMAAVFAWATYGTDEPEGWVKNGQTRELRLNG